MEIKTLEFSGLLSALQALRLPFGKDPRSRLDYNLKTTEKEDVLFLDSGYYIEMNPNDLELLSTIIKRGDEHAKVLRGVLSMQNRSVDNPIGTRFGLQPNGRIVYIINIIREEHRVSRHGSCGCGINETMTRYQTTGVEWADLVDLAADEPSFRAYMTTHPRVS